MSAQHTQGRLLVGALLQRGEKIPLMVDHFTIAEVLSAFRHDVDKANARRLVSCWNYCEGLDTEGMELAVEIDRPAKVFIDQAYIKEMDLIAQRDQLLTELEKARAFIAAYNQSYIETVTDPKTGLITDPDDVLAAEADQDVLNGIDRAIAACKPQPVVQHLPSDDTEGGGA